MKETLVYREENDNYLGANEIRETIIKANQLANYLQEAAKFIGKGLLQRDICSEAFVEDIITRWFELVCDD